MKSKSDKPFFEYIKESKSSFIIGILLVAGTLLIFLGSFGEKEKTSTGEDRLSEMCSMIDGVGDCRVMITYTSDREQVFSVLILCEGAESVSVRRDLTEAVCALYGIGANRVEIFSLNEEYVKK